MVNIRKLEAELWESADLLRQGSKLTSNQYCMPVLGLIFLRYAYSRFKKVEESILKDRPSRGGRVLPVEASDFVAKNALFLPREAQYAYLLTLPADIPSAGLRNTEAAKNQLLGKAVADAQAKAQVLTQAAGVTLKDIQSIDYSWDRIDFEIQPMNRMLMAKECADEAAGFEINIDPDDIDVSDTVTVLWEIG